MLQCYGIIANYYSQINENKKCENTYIKYIILIEKFYLKESLETSNAYFMVGVYYFEQKLSQKAVACFIKTLAIR